MPLKETDFLQINKFGDLHDGKRIFFCRTEYVSALFKKIKKIKNEVVLITGNSDEGINERYTANIPDNIAAWYCQNNLQYHQKIKSIPLGLENTFTNMQPRQGGAWPHAVGKMKSLTEIYNCEDKPSPTGLLYGNFNAQTNITHRGPLRQTCIESKFIKWDDSILPYDKYISAVIDHEAVLCPAGNGVDTHRIYEVLYCGRVAVTIKMGDFPLYEDLYKKLPVVILNTASELQDEDGIRRRIATAREKPADLNLLAFEYWKKKITGSLSLIPEKKDTFFDRVLNLITLAR